MSAATSPAATTTSPLPEPAEDVGRARRLSVGLLLLLLVTGLAVAVPIHEAYVSNQNQYLLPVVGPTIERLEADWLLGTVDPYPLFTLVSSGLFAAGGKPAFLAGAVAAAALAWWALYLLARDLIGESRRSPAVLATVAVAAAQYLPFMPNVFGGVANQYILEQPMYYQPAAAGSLVLLAAALALRARIRRATLPRATWVAALIAAAVGCALHPTYLVVAGLLLFCAMLVDLATGRRTLRLVAGYAATVAVLAVAAIAANPAIVDLAGGDPDVMSRFAFERIGHHTLPSQWGIWDLRYLAVIGIAAALWWRAASWFARWLLLSLSLAMALALVVEMTRNTSLALAFPARATVILVPLSMAAVAAWGLRWLLRTDLAPFLRRRGAWLVAPVVVLAAAGVVQTVERHSGAPDEVTALLAAAQPEGVGLVPLGRADGVRLNAGAAVFVDHKSPPYASDDLAEWFRRLDAVEAAQLDARRYCDLLAAERIDWVVLGPGALTPSCVADWQEAGNSARFRVLTAAS